MTELQQDGPMQLPQGARIGPQWSPVELAAMQQAAADRTLVPDCTGCGQPWWRPYVIRYCPQCGTKKPWATPEPKRFNNTRVLTIRLTPDDMEAIRSAAGSVRKSMNQYALGLLVDAARSQLVELAIGCYEGADLCQMGVERLLGDPQPAATWDAEKQEWVPA